MAKANHSLIMIIRPLLLATWVWCAATQDIPVPIEFTPSGYWDGNDGPWSTFTIAVGTPPQPIRVLPSIAQNVITIVRPDDCLDDKFGFANCTESRGGAFDYSKSKSWTGNGDSDVDPTGDGMFTRRFTFGTDTVGIGLRPQASKMMNQTVGLMHRFSNSYVGIVGISPVAANWTADHQLTQTFFEALRGTMRIPSRTVAYTAGIWSRNITGSLILGGYDASRMSGDHKNTITLAMKSERRRELSVGLKSITLSDNTTSTSESPTEILQTPLALPIEPLISRIWLPKAICQSFEKALGLTYDTTQSLYYITDAQHEAFLARNLSFTFTLTDSNLSSDGPTGEIHIPYDLLALNAMHPLTEKPGRYFPIQQAIIPSTAVLGRAFLQAAYLVADYDRLTLNVSPANLQDSTEARLLTITPPGPNGTVSPNELVTSGGGGKAVRLGAGEVAGIAILIVALVIGGIVLVLIIRRRRRKRRELAERKKREDEEVAKKRDDEARRQASEAAPGSPEDTRAELDGEGNIVYEKDGVKRLEMDGTGTPAELSPVAVRGELPGDTPISELEGSPIWATDEKKKPHDDGPLPEKHIDKHADEDVSPLERAASAEGEPVKDSTMRKEMDITPI